MMSVFRSLKKIVPLVAPALGLVPTTVLQHDQRSASWSATRFALRPFGGSAAKFWSLDSRNPFQRLPRGSSWHQTVLCGPKTGVPARPASLEDGSWLLPIDDEDGDDPLAAHREIEALTSLAAPRRSRGRPKKHAAPSVSPSSSSSGAVAAGSGSVAAGLLPGDVAGGEGLAQEQEELDLLAALQGSVGVAPEVLEANAVKKRVLAKAMVKAHQDMA